MVKYPGFNWVICHSPYSVEFVGVEGTDWGYAHYELDTALFRTIGSVLPSSNVFSIFWFFFLLILAPQTDTIFIMQGLERSVDMEMVDLSTYVPTFQTFNSTMI